MKNDNSIEGNKLIAEFMDYWSFNDGTPNKIPTPAEIDELSYHTSWDWQIPAWSKVVPLMQQILKGNSPAENKRLYLYEQYEFAVMNNKPIDGFNVLVQAITWYNQTKIKTNEQ